MTGFYQPDLSENIDSPFVRDGNNKLVRRSYWLDMNDRTLVMVMTNGIGANLTNDEKRAHLADLRREHLIDQVCIQEYFRLKNNEYHCPRYQAIQNGLALSKSAVQRDIPISCKHLSSRLCSSLIERAQCHHAVISCLKSLQCKPLRGCSAR